jgi:hypothetical protein
MLSLVDTVWMTRYSAVAFGTAAVEEQLRGRREAQVVG